MKSNGVLQSKTPPSLASKRLFAIFVVVGLILCTYVQMTHFSSHADARRTVIFMGGVGLGVSTESQPMSGDYLVKWKTRGSCSYQADLNGISAFSTMGATSGAEKITLTSSTYRVHMVTDSSSDCAWQVSFNPS